MHLCISTSIYIIVGRLFRHLRGLFKYCTNHYNLQLYIHISRNPMNDPTVPFQTPVNSIKHIRLPPACHHFSYFIVDDKLITYFFRPLLMAWQAETEINQGRAAGCATDDKLIAITTCSRRIILRTIGKRERKSFNVIAPQKMRWWKDQQEVASHYYRDVWLMKWWLPVFPNAALEIVGKPSSGWLTFFCRPSSLCRIISLCFFWDILYIFISHKEFFFFFDFFVVLILSFTA